MNLPNDLGGQTIPDDGERSNEVQKSGQEPEPETWRFCIYVSGPAPNSLRAMANLFALAREYLHGRFHIEVIDILDNPLRTFQDGVLVTPTTIKHSPLPEVRLIGNLDNRSEVLIALGLGDEIQ